MLQLTCCWLSLSPRCLCLWLLCSGSLTTSEMIWAFCLDCDSIGLVICRFKSCVLLWSFLEHLQSCKKLCHVCQFVHPSVHPSMFVYVYQCTSNWIDFFEIWWIIFGQPVHFINLGTSKEDIKQWNFLYLTATRGLCWHMNVVAREAGRVSFKKINKGLQNKLSVYVPVAFVMRIVT